MSFVDLYTSGEHRRNLAHFAAIATLAAIDGEVNPRRKNNAGSFCKKIRYKR